MDTDELDSMFEDYSTVKVKLYGYVRDYSKVSHSWSGKGVLGIAEKPGEWCNGLLILGLTPDEFEEYSARELGCSIEEYFETDTGYNIHTLDPEKIQPYDESIEFPTPIYTVTINHRLEEADTHAEYKELCESAAHSYGPEFYEDFVKTTYEYYDHEIHLPEGVDDIVY